MKLVQCDRCGKIEKTAKSVLVEVSDNGDDDNGTTKRYDFCPACVRVLYDALAPIPVVK